MRFTVVFDTDGDAFVEPCPRYEIAALLRTIADRIERGDEPPFGVRDTNGNSCGMVDHTKTPAEVQAEIESERCSACGRYGQCGEDSEDPCPNVVEDRYIEGCIAAIPGPGDPT